MGRCSSGSFLRSPPAPCPPIPGNTIAVCLHPILEGFPVLWGGWDSRKGQAAMLCALPGALHYPEGGERRGLEGCVGANCGPKALGSHRGESFLQRQGAGSLGGILGGRGETGAQLLWQLRHKLSCPERLCSDPLCTRNPKLACHRE